MKKILGNFWEWYERHYTLNLSIASFLFFWQILHLTWLFTHVIWARLFGYSLWNPNVFWEQAIIYVDYTEIPALVSIGIVYANELRKKYNFKSAVCVIFLLSQVFHIFWITDEFVVASFTGGSGFVTIPPVLAWVAIFIDYLEVPVMVETFGRLYRRIKKL